ncbi:MAG: hypothetical protein CMK70_16285 [Pseudohongiella sp.]|nr:hypothetical protein [Pseudohongiella sp.]|tara:strand:+ start:697 stop:1134 length:438 start_codon:yes stop_codon:yes gene_type:complete
MLWVTGIVCLAVGLVAGLLVGKKVQTGSPTRIAELEAQIQELQRSHADYREHVSSHFDTTAELVQQMTESYRDVYQHLATGAQQLCTEDVASKLLPAGEQTMFVSDADQNDTLEPPKDYAPKKSPGPGALSEEFGLDRNTSRAEE